MAGKVKPASRPLPPTPPNGGWGWAVVAASFFSNFIVDGVLYTFGILLVELLDTFKASRTQTALVGSLLGGTYLIVGPIVSVLVNKFGCRAVTICGSILASTFFFISTYSTSIEMMLVTYGILGGIGFGMLYLPSIVMVGIYFDTKRAAATGIAVCGSGLGTFVFAPLARILLDTYGWRGANKIISGIILNAIACGLVYLPLKSPKHRPLPPTDINLNAVPDAEGLDEVDASLHEAEVEAARPMNRVDVLYQGSVPNINEFKASPDMATYIDSVTNIAGLDVDDDDEEKKRALWSCSKWVENYVRFLTLS